MKISFYAFDLRHRKIYLQCFEEAHILEQYETCWKLWDPLCDRQASDRYATAGWKLLLLGQIFDSFIKSGNIRWEASHEQVGHIKGTGLHAKLSFLTLDGENTNVAADDDMIDLLNLLKG